VDRNLQLLDRRCAGGLLAFVVGLQEKGIWLGLTVGLATATGLLMWRFWGRSVRISSAA
jgi:MATE family multidrug resistance protein